MSHTREMKIGGTRYVAHFDGQPGLTGWVELVRYNDKETRIFVPVPLLVDVVASWVRAARIGEIEQEDPAVLLGLKEGRY